MLRGILPKEYAFFDIFEKLIEINKQISQVFINMVEGKLDLNESSKTIKNLEREADKITHSCTDLLHRTFITPMDRDDIYQLIKTLDGFADNVNAAAFRLANFGITQIRQDTIEFAKILHTGTLELEVAIKGLRNIKKSDLIREKCNKIHELENLADDIHRKAVSNLFKENDIFLLIKWKEIFERLEKSVDKLEKTASTIETILIDNS